MKDSMMTKKEDGDDGVQVLKREKMNEEETVEELKRE